ncbi:DUF6218 family protein [Pseudonocardia sp.]|uniref:DUF6218 family protein n=1 Tax=Pseudonocardia sp. TaxID=60912 RepID=UPI003D0C9280
MDSVIEEASGLAEPAAALWAPGSAVLAAGEDEFGQPAVAVWQVSPDGHLTGAWVVPERDAYNDPAAARRLLVSIERRALAATPAGAVDETVARLTGAAGIDTGRWWDKQLFFPVEAFQEVLGRRAEFEATVAAIRGGGRTVAPLEWERTFSPDDRPTTISDLARLAGIAAPAGAPVVVEALRTSRVLQWLIGLWTRTEQPKNRRDYLRDKHGEPDALPPAWLDAVLTASDTRLPL